MSLTHLLTYYNPQPNLTIIPFLPVSQYCSLKYYHPSLTRTGRFRTSSLSHLCEGQVTRWINCIRSGPIRILLPSDVKHVSVYLNMNSFPCRKILQKSTIMRQRVATLNPQRNVRKPVRVKTPSTSNKMCFSFIHSMFRSLVRSTKLFRKANKCPGMCECDFITQQSPTCFGLTRCTWSTVTIFFIYLGFRAI